MAAVITCRRCGEPMIEGHLYFPDGPMAVAHARCIPTYINRWPPQRRKPTPRCWITHAQD